MNKLKKLLLISSALLLSTANNTFAATASGSISASGVVTGTCSVTASSMTFTALGTAGTDTAVSTVTPTCSVGTTYAVTNAGNNNYLYRTGASSPPGDADTIEFPIKLTGGVTPFTQTNGGTIKLIGTGTGSPVANETTLTGTAGSSTGKTAGNYTGSVTLTITY